ncbi:MAG TPA: sulfurtransferase TusA family protein [Acidimicrobiia bacterium]|jgi:tRNA 2-thiouridine synthesizing protein A|nr:sulfurtransferase TusA family protein [Acidimicrobiia bacterium]
MADATVDARGLQCPMPVIKTAQAMGGLTSGQTLEVIATDRGALSDIPAWTRDMGHSLKEEFEADSEFHFVIQKA